jgi:L-amino acid N-acyltransferase YncA
MEIRKTRMEELDQVMAIYAHARKFMAEHGNATQWGHTKPARELVVEDILQGRSYVCVEDGQIAAVFFYQKGIDPTYNIIYDGAWKNDLDYGVVHRIASAGTVKGAGAFCLNWAFEQCGNLKIDTHHNNIVMQNLLKKLGFEYCGIIHLVDGDERLAYQKVK